MKKLTKIHLIIAMISFGLFSCGGDDDSPAVPAPSVSVSASVDGSAITSGSEVEVGTEISLTATVTAAGGVNTLYINNTDYNRAALGAEAGDTQGTITVTSTVPAEAEGANLIYNFVGVDDAGLISDTTKFTVSVVGPASPAVNTYTTVLLGAQGNSAEGFYDALTNTRYGYAAARDASGIESSPIDLAYYWGASNNSTIAAIDNNGLHLVYDLVGLPIEGIFGTRNATRFLSSELSAAEYDAVATNADLESAAAFEVAGNSSVTNLVVDQVIAIKLADARGGTFGLVKVVSVDDTNGNGTITIEVKMPGATD